MAIEREQLRNTVFDHYAREVAANPRWSEQRKLDTLAQMKQAYDLAMQTDSAPEFLYFSSLAPEEAERQLALYAQDSDPKVTERFYAPEKARRSAENTRRRLDEPGSRYVNALFAPVADTAPIRHSYSDPAIDEPFGAALREIEATPIPVPQGLTDDVITFAVMGEYLDERRIREVLDQKRAAFPPQVGNGLFSEPEGVKESFFASMIQNDDRRPNAQLGRLVAPEARRSVQESVAQFEAGNPAPLAEALLRAFNSAYVRVLAEPSKRSEVYALCTRVMHRCMSILDTPAFAGAVTIPAQRREIARSLCAERCDLTEADELRTELLDSCRTQAFLPSGSMPMADPVFRAKAERMYALRYLTQATEAELSNFKKNLEPENDRAVMDRYLTERPLTGLEALAAADREALIETIIENYVRTESKEYAALYDANAGKILELVGEKPLPGGFPMNQNFEGFVAHTMSGLARFTENHPDLDLMPVTRAAQQALSEYNRMRTEGRTGLDDLHSLIPALEAVGNEATALFRKGREDTTIMALSTQLVNLENRFAECRRARDGETALYTAVQEKGVALPEICADTLLSPQARSEKRLAAENRDPLPEAERWFDSFIAQLSERGIRFDNPLSLGLVKSFDPDFQYDEFLRAVEENTPASARKTVELSGRVSSYPFLPEQLQKSLPYRGDDFAGFLAKNLKDPAAFTAADKLRLYRLAQENRLYIERATLDEDSVSNIAYAKIAEDGSARFTDYTLGTNIDFKKAPENYSPEDWAAFEAAGFRRDELRTVILHGKMLSDVNLFSKTAFSTCLSEIDDLRDAGEKLSQTKNLTDAFCWLRNGRRLIVRAQQHPGWVDTPEKAGVQNELIRLTGTPDALWSAQDTALLEQDYTCHEELGDLERKLCRYFRVDSIHDVPFDRITDANGTPFGSGENYADMNRLFKAAYNGDIIRLDGRDMLFVGSANMFIKGTRHDPYIAQADAIAKELKSTDSFFSDDTDSYKALAAGLSKLPAQLRSLKNSDTVAGRGHDALCRQLDAAAELGRNYQEAHRGLTELSSRQIARLTAIAKLQDLRYEAKFGDERYDRDTYRLAFKIALEQASSMAAGKDRKKFVDGKNALMNYNLLREQALILSEDPGLKAMAAGKTPAQLEKLLSAKPGELQKAYLLQKQRNIAPMAPKQPLASPSISPARHDVSVKKN